jgi:hypothetical protein
VYGAMGLPIPEMAHKDQLSYFGSILLQKRLALLFSWYPFFISYMYYRVTMCAALLSVDGCRMEGQK